MVQEYAKRLARRVLSVSLSSRLDSARCLKGVRGMKWMGILRGSMTENDHNSREYPEE